VPVRLEHAFGGGGGCAKTEADLDSLLVGNAPGVAQPVRHIEVARDFKGFGGQLGVVDALDLEGADLVADAVMADHVAAVATGVGLDKVRRNDTLVEMKFAWIADPDFAAFGPSGGDHVEDPRTGVVGLAIVQPGDRGVHVLGDGWRQDRRQFVERADDVRVTVVLEALHEARAQKQSHGFVQGQLERRQQRRAVGAVTDAVLSDCYAYLLLDRA